MERWRGKVAVVTGASSGIGEAVLKDLLRYGIRVAALARRENRLKEIRAGLPENQRSLMHSLKCDVTNEEDVKNTFAMIDKKLGGIDILVNNAGIMKMMSILDPNNSKVLKDTMDTNVMGVMYCTREAFNSMKRRYFDGHIFLMNSMSGHRVPDFGPAMSASAYAPSKFAVTALTETYRQEFANAGTKIKVTSISPGPVATEIFSSEFDHIKDKVKMLDAEDISQAIVYSLSTRPHVQVQEITIRPVAVDMPAVVKQFKLEEKFAAHK